MRKPKFRGRIDLTDSLKPCPSCDSTMTKEIKPDLTGKYWACLKCSHTEGL